MSALFETFGIDWHLLFAQGVNFAILAVALTWLLYKPVLRMVRERQAVIEKGVADAMSASRALESAEGEAKRKTDAAEIEASGIVDRARQAAHDEKARITKEAEERAAKIASDADLRAKETAAKALRESEQEIARLAVLAAGKALAKD